MSMTTDPRQGRPQSKELNRAILEGTLEVLAEVGFEALSVAEVARRARSTTPAIYRRFTGKWELVFAALNHDLESLPDAFSDQGSLRADLTAWTSTVSAAMTARRIRILAGLLLASRTEPELVGRFVAALRQSGDAGWTALIARAVARGELHGVPDSTVLPQVPGAVITSLALLVEPALTDAKIDELVDTVMLPALHALDRQSSSERDTKRGTPS